MEEMKDEDSNVQSDVKGGISKRSYGTAKMPFPKKNIIRRKWNKSESAEWNLTKSKCSQKFHRKRYLIERGIREGYLNVQ